MDSFLLLAFLFLIAGVVAVPIASMLGLGSVLGYLIAGIALSPILSALHVDVVSLQHFAEFGVVMMLFLVGLELEPKILWQMRSRLLGLGGLQVAGTVAAIMGIAMAFGQPWTVALAIGFVLALSSTAIVLQTLNEKGLMKSDGGQASFSVLLFQDIAVIPMLAFIPLLALPELLEPAIEAARHSGDDHGLSMNIVAGMAGWERMLVTIGAIIAVIIGGNFLTRPLFRFISKAKLRELFTATALLMVIGIALLMTIVGLSPALGTFLAGVVLANSEYRHELESDIEPFKGLLLGLFFITVGAAINFALLFDNLALILGLSIGLIALKAAILFVLSYIFKVEGSDRYLFALGLAQAGEFGFVLLSFTVANGVIPTPIADQLLLVVALSMLLTPLLFIFYDRVIVPRANKLQAAEPDMIDEQGTAIIAGHGRFGGVVNRILLGTGYKTVVLDHHSEQLELLRTFGFRIFFGDATRPDLLEAAGIEHAKIIVVAIDGKSHITELVHYVHKNYPHVHIVARAVDRDHVYHLYQAGADDIIRDTFDSAVRAGRSALEALGQHPFDVERLTRDFVTHDKAALRALAEVFDMDTPPHLNAAYVERAKELRKEQEDMMQKGSLAFGGNNEQSWVPPKPLD